MIKVNFNAKSAGAWATLLTAVVAGVINILSALGVVVKPTDATVIYNTITAILSLLTTMGVLYASTDKTKEDK